MPWRDALIETWRDVHHSAQAKIDYALGGAAITSPVWVPTMADTTQFFVMLTAIGGFVLICIRIWRNWKRGKQSDD